MPAVHSVFSSITFSRYKGKLQDLKKAQWYLEKLIEEKTEWTAGIAEQN